MPFNRLPLEINEHIASELDSDRDVCNFRLVCQATNSAVESHRCGLWRKLYARRFDMPVGVQGIELKMNYQIRSRFLRKRVPKFLMGQEQKEIRCMEKLRDLVVESFAHVKMGYNGQPSNNIRELHRFITVSNILDQVLTPFLQNGNFNPLLHTLQLIFTHWQFDLSFRFHTYGFPYSQNAVYGHPDDFPIFLDENRFHVNIKFLLHIANFFKCHMTQENEHTLFSLYSELAAEQKPRAWEGPLQQGPGAPGVKKLGKHWMGSYAYLDTSEIPYIRAAQVNDRYIFTDNIVHFDDFQTLELDFSNDGGIAPWPKAFNSHLDSLPTETLCRALHSLSKRRNHPRNQHRVHSHHPIAGRTRTRDTGLATPPQSPGAPDRHTIIMPQRIHPTAASDMLPTQKSLPPVRSAKKGHNYLQFSGSGNDALPFHCSGIVHPLPPQHEIPGWQRITMMKYNLPARITIPQSASIPSSGPANTAISSITPNTPSGIFPYPLPSPVTPTSDDSFQFGEDADVDGECWCYEGVVLPGGMIMLGRWWSPMDDASERLCTGPFIFWNVKGDEED